MISHPAGTLKIIKSVELSSISTFSQYAESASKYHPPGSLLEHFSKPLGLENMPWTCSKTLLKSCPSKSAPHASKGSKNLKSGPQRGTQNHSKIDFARFGFPGVTLSATLVSHLVPGGPKLYQNVTKKVPKWYRYC